MQSNTYQEYKEGVEDPGNPAPLMLPMPDIATPQVDIPELVMLNATIKALESDLYNVFHKRDLMVQAHNEEAWEIQTRLSQMQHRREQLLTE